MHVSVNDSIRAYLLHDDLSIFDGQDHLIINKSETQKSTEMFDIVFEKRERMRVIFLVPIVSEELKSFHFISATN